MDKAEEGIILDLKYCLEIISSNRLYEPLSLMSHSDDNNDDSNSDGNES
jgi:hypothetical protein